MRYRKVDKVSSGRIRFPSSYRPRCMGRHQVILRVYHPAARLPPAKKPLLVRTLLEPLGGGKDGDLMVASTPHVLGNTEIEIASRIILSKAECRLPTVYVSSKFAGGHLLDVNKLASDLQGMAHVVVEPNRPFSVRLKLETDSQNVYGGGVGIYWPDGGGRRSFFVGRQFESPSDVSKAVLEEVRIALTNRRPMERCTWASVQELVSRQTFDSLKSSGSHQIEQYIENFDNELSSKDEKLVDAEREIARLKAELRIYESRTPSASGVTLVSGAEQDLYPNEIAEVILDALNEYRDRVPNDSRRSHIVTALLSRNLSHAEAATNREKLRRYCADLRVWIKRLGVA